MRPDVERREARPREVPTAVARHTVRVELRRLELEDEMPEPRDYRRARPYVFPEVTR